MHTIEVKCLCVWTSKNIPFVVFLFSRRLFLFAWLQLIGKLAFRMTILEDTHWTHALVVIPFKVEANSSNFLLLQTYEKKIADFRSFLVYNSLYIWSCLPYVETTSFVALHAMFIAEWVFLDAHWALHIKLSHTEGKALIPPTQ